MKKIAVIGESLVEIMADQPGQGFHTPLALTGPYPSGAPAIFASQAARLGQPVALISTVGRDDFGTMQIARLAADGVDTSAIAVHPDLPTGTAFVRYRPDGNRDFVFNIRHSASGATTLGAAAHAILNRTDHLHVMGTALFSPALVQANLTAIDMVRARGGTVSFDPNLRKEILDAPGLRDALTRILALCDLYLPSGTELTLLTRAQTETAAVAEVLTLGPRAVVLKRGAGGASLHTATQTHHHPAFAVTEVDPTGAGDCFGAAFVTFWLREMPLDQCLALACAAGALAVTRRGPMEGAGTMDQVQTMAR